MFKDAETRIGSISPDMQDIIRNKIIWFIIYWNSSICVIPKFITWKYGVSNDEVSIEASGDIYASTVISGGSNGTSDERLKADITPLSNSLEKLKNHNAVDFSWKDHSKGWATQSPRDIGLIAQEVEKEFPTMVGTMADGYKGIRYDRLVPVLVDSIKTQDKKIEKLEAFVEKLINDLEEK